MRGCIFDLDGTLTDTLDSLTYSVNLTLEEMGLPGITEEQCRLFVGNGARYLMEKALRASGDANLSRIEEGMAVYGRIFSANCTYHVTPYKGILELLEQLKVRGIKLAVLSNKPHGQTVDVVKQIFGENVFDYVQGQCENLARKPDPSGVWKLLEEMGISREECLYVGDSEVDVKTAEAAGVQEIAVTWGFRDRVSLEKAGAMTLIDSPRELLAYV